MVLECELLNVVHAGQGVLAIATHIPESRLPALLTVSSDKCSCCYAGLPFVNAICDTESCGKSQAANISVEYWFPPGFA